MTVARHEMPPRDAEVRRSLALQAAGVGDVAIDIRSGRVSLSREGASLVGLEPEEVEIALDSFLQLIHDDDRPALTDAIERIVAERTVVEMRFRVVHPDGAVRWLLGRGQYHDDGSSRRILYVMVDIQRQVELEELSASHKDVLVHQRDELERLNGQLQALSARVVRAQEEERLRISRELHDEIGQVLTACVMNLELGAAAQGPEAVQLQQEVLRDLRHALRQLRQLSLELRPPLLDEGGLEAALRWMLERMLATRRIEYQLTIEGLTQRLPPALEITTYRIIQEALTNVIRHAGARHVQVELHVSPDELILRVGDDGRGFDVNAVRRRSRDGDSLGVLNLSERAVLVGGQCEIVSTPGAGCVVLAWLPLPRNTPRATN